PRLGLLLVPAVLLACSSRPPLQNGGTGGTGAGGASTGGTSTGGTSTGGTSTGGSTSSGAPAHCTWTKKTSNAACPSGPCPIVLDEELTCDDANLAWRGLRVAPAPDATWLATPSSGDRLVYRITATGEERQDGVPQDFAGREISLAMGPDGAV